MTSEKKRFEEGRASDLAMKRRRAATRPQSRQRAQAVTKLRTVKGPVEPGSSKRTVISLFTGAMGLDLGLEAAGFTVRVAVEPDAFAANTVAKNRPHLPILREPLEKLSTRRILKTAGLRRGEATLVAGGPCCQPFSTAGRRGSLGDKSRGNLFREFCRVVRGTRPRFFVMENVPGVLSAAVKHRPLNERGAGFPALTGQELLGSALVVMLRELSSLGYHVSFAVLNAADFGVPQARQRVIFVGSRDKEPIVFPEATHSDTCEDLLPWVTLRDALKGLKDRKPVYSKFSPTTLKVLKKIPSGGNWRSLSPYNRKKVMGRAYDSWGGRVGFFRRLSFDRPTPSLTTSPDGRATMIGHPKKLRPLSVREYARVQQFPDDWQFVGTVEALYRQLGNAVPVGLGKVIGITVRRAMRTRSRVVGRRVVSCPDALLTRLAQGHTTRLNPPRMRKIKSIAKSSVWRASSKARNPRTLLLSIVTPNERLRLKRAVSHRTFNPRSLGKRIARGGRGKSTLFWRARRRLLRAA